MVSSFRPPLWSVLLTVAGVALFAVLGTWQLGRGFDKQARAETFSNPAPAQRRLARDTKATAEPTRVRATGTYQGQRQLLQDGHARGGRPGFEVWTPMRLADGSLAMVNRGWVPQPARLDDLQAPPAPSEAQSVEGWWRSLPEPGIRAAEPACEPAARFPVQVVYPRHADLECFYGEPVLDGLLLLDAAAPGGFQREWSAGGLPPERHFGYAVTWYALGITALVLFIKLNLKSGETP